MELDDLEQHVREALENSAAALPDLQRVAHKYEPDPKVAITDADDLYVAMMALCYWTATVEQIVAGRLRLVVVPETAVCWLCGEPGAATEIVVECDTPGGKACKPKTVRVHWGCYMDMED